MHLFVFCVCVGAGGDGGGGGHVDVVGGRYLERDMVKGGG